MNTGNMGNQITGAFPFQLQRPNPISQPAQRLNPMASPFYPTNLNPQAAVFVPAAPQTQAEAINRVLSPGDWAPRARPTARYLYDPYN